MPESGTYGSVRGALSNGRPYRDLGALLFRAEAGHELWQRHPLLELDSVHWHVLAPALGPAPTLRLIVGWGLAEDHC